MSNADPADAALAYSLWDSVNSVRMERPDDVEYHIARAREVRRFLLMRGFDIVRVDFPKSESPR